LRVSRYEIVKIAAQVAGGYIQTSDMSWPASKSLERNFKLKMGEKISNLKARRS
jgi:hypothetical protein